MKRLLWPVVALVVLGMGCTSVETMNIQRSLLRGTGDSGVTIVLENQSEDEVDSVKKGIKDICNDVMLFLSTGNTSLLTRDALKLELLDVVPDGSADFINDIVSLVNVTADVDAIGSRNVKRIRAFLKGVIKGVDEYDVGDRG